MSELEGERKELEKLQITTEVLPKEAKIVVMKIKEKICPVCNKISPSRAVLVKHMKARHPKEYKRFKAFLSKEPEEEVLIGDWKTYTPLKLIETRAGKRILADDHRIVHTWWNRLKRGQAMKSKQFASFNLEEQKKIVRKLHEKILEAFTKLEWKHRSPLGEQTLIGPPEKVIVEDLEDIDDEYVKGLSDKQVRNLYRRLHWLYHNKLRRITEPLHNAHVFVWKALKKRNLKFKPVGDRLDRETKKIVVEYPKPEGFSKMAVSPKIFLDRLSKDMTLTDALDLFPDLVVIDEEPIHVYLCGGIVNRGKALQGHDVDILFKQDTADSRIVHQFVDDLCAIDKNLGRKLHFVWDTKGPTIGYSVPLYRLAFKKVTPQEMQRKSPYEYLGQKILVMRPFRALKPKSGFHKHEFFEVQEFWDKWGAKVVGKGIVVQKKYDGMRFQIHVQGDRIKIITEDKHRDRASVFSKSVKELMTNKKVNSFVLDAEMVEYNCFGKAVKDKETICQSLKREKMITWITSTKKALDDQNVVFHIHDCLFFKGEDIHEKGYIERWNAIDRCFPRGLSHWRKVPSSEAKDVRSFFKAVKRERTRPGSEGVVAKTKDSIYKLTGRTGEWAKLKNLKEIDVMVWDVVQKKTKAGARLQQWIYYPVFSVPCAMKAKIKENQFVEWKGKCYAKIGRAYGTKVKAARGDIITVRPVQIVENKDERTGKIWWSWMFPFFEAKKTDKKAPDSLTTVRRIVKVGTAPLSEQLSKDEVIQLPKCPYWDDPSLCPLRDRFWVPPKDKLTKVFEEFLKFPIVCKFAYRFKCHFIKKYYYDLKPVRDYNMEKSEEIEEEA